MRGTDVVALLIRCATGPYLVFMVFAIFGSIPSRDFVFVYCAHRCLFEMNETNPLYLDTVLITPFKCYM
jgi:hypothetical protein